MPESSSNKNFLDSIEAVVFDFDDTLVDEQYSVRERWKKVLGDYAHMHPDLEKTFFRIHKEKGPEYKMHLSDAFKELKLDEAGVRPLVETFLAARAQELLMPGARELLNYLVEKGLKLGIITNGTRNYQESRIKNAGIHDLFTFISYGDEYRKPDPYWFKACLEHFKLKDPLQLLYVGNHIEEDIETALAVGAKACLVSSAEFVGGIRAIRVKNLEQLLDTFKTYYETR